MRYWLAHVHGDDLVALQQATGNLVDQALADGQAAPERVADLNHDLNLEIQRRHILVASRSAA